MGQVEAFKFIVDHNVGKMAKWLRMMGYDTLFFNGGEDSKLVAIALEQGRFILIRDSGIIQRRLIKRGKIRALLIEGDRIESQMKQVVDTLGLDIHFKPFSVCLECNQPLEERNKQQVEGRVPPYVFKTQQQYMECPACGRIYWRGTHWQEMNSKLEKLTDKPKQEAE